MAKRIGWFHFGRFFWKGPFNQLQYFALNMSDYLPKRQKRVERSNLLKKAISRGKASGNQESWSVC